MGLSRRGFIKALGLGVAAVALAPYVKFAPRLSREDQKIAFIRELIRRGIEAHDRAIEEALYATNGPLAELTRWTPDPYGRP